MLAPEIAEFTEAQIPEIRSGFPELDHWIANYFLNSVFGPNYEGKWRIYALNLIFRGQNCIYAYEDARELTEEFLQKTRPGRPPIGLYFRTLSKWEQSFYNLKTSIDLFKAMNDGVGVFAKGDGSVFEKAYYLANIIKHYEKDVSAIPDSLIASGLLPANEGEPHALPMWLTNEGFSSPTMGLSFTEYAGVVRDIATLCDKLHNTGEFIEDLRARRKAEESN